MAAVNLLGSVADSTTGISAVTGSVSPSANALVLCGIIAHPAGGPAFPASVSGAGLTWTLVDEQSHDVNNGTIMSLYRADAGASPGSGAVTVSFAGGQDQIEILVSVVEVTGVDPVGTVVQTAKTSGNSAVALATLAAFGKSDNVTYGLVAAGGLGFPLTPGAGFTQAHALQGAQTGDNCLTEYRLDADTTVDAALNAADPWGVIACEIKTAAATVQTLLPDATVSAGAWTPVGAATAHEATADTNAGTYAKSDANSTLELGLTTGQTPQAGSQTLTYELSGRPQSALMVGLYQGAALVEQWLTDPLPSALTQVVRTLAASISDLSDLRVRATVQDAAAPPAPTVTFGAIGTGADGSTTVLPSYPAGITAGQYLTLHVSSGASTNPTPNTPAGWTLLATGVSTDGTYSVDSGPRRMTVFGKVALGTETGTQQVIIVDGNTCRGTIIRWGKSNPTDVWDVVAQGANDSTSGTSFAATTAAIGWQPGDAAMACVGQRVDTGTQSAQALTAAGITFGARTNRASTAVTIGNDHRHVVDTFAPVTAGTATVATTWAYTASESVSGGLVVVRLRCAPATERARLYEVEFEAPFAAASPPQLLGPTSTTTAGSWAPVGAATLHEAVDEAVASDTDYAVTAVADDMRLAFSAAPPAVQTDPHRLSYRIGSTSSDAMTVSLMMGSTTIASWAHDPAPAVPTTFAQTLSAPQAAAITNYGTLAAVFSPAAAGGTAGRPTVLVRPDTLAGPLTPSGQITATQGQLIQGMQITTTVGPGVIVPPGVTGVRVWACEIGPCGTSDLNDTTGVGVLIESGAAADVAGCVLHDVASGVYSLNGSNPILVEYNYGYNIRGPKPRGQLVQFNGVQGGTVGSRVRFNLSDAKVGIRFGVDHGGGLVLPDHGIEDHISLHDHTGVVGQRTEVAWNHLRGGHNLSTTGSGMILGDGQNPGGNVWAHHNTVVEVKNTGIGVAGGDNIDVEDNRIYLSGTADFSGATSDTHTGMYSINFAVPTTPTCGNHNFRRNRVWAIHNGLAGHNEFFDSTDCSPVTQTDNVMPDATLSEAIFDDGN